VLCVTVYASVDFVLLVDQLEFVFDFLLNGGDAPWVLAFDHVSQSLRKVHVEFFLKAAVFYYVYRDVVVYITEDVVVKLNVAVDFDYVLLAVFGAGCVLNNGNTAVKFVQAEKLIDLHALSCLDMVQYDSVFYSIYVHLFTSLVAALSDTQKLQNEGHSDVLAAECLVEIAGSRIVVDLD